MKFFFASGLNKSGTTYLQTLLDSHPAINCPSEQHLNSLITDLKSLGEKYHKTITGIDHTTSRQGVSFNHNAFTNNSLRTMLTTLASFGVTDATTHMGIHDNSLITRYTYWSSLFPAAQFIFIVRDPRAISYSIWRHRNRTDTAFAAANIPLKKSMQAMAETDWPRFTQNLRAFQELHPNRVTVIRYEDLAGEQKQQHLSNLFTALDVDYDTGLVQGILQKNNFDSLQKEESATDGGYFHSGTDESWRGVMTDEMEGFFTTHCQQTLLDMGYK